MGFGVGQRWDAIPIFATLCPLQHRCGGSPHLTQLFRELNSFRILGGEHVSGPENISQVLFSFLSLFCPVLFLLFLFLSSPRTQMVGSSFPAQHYGLVIFQLFRFSAIYTLLLWLGWNFIYNFFLLWLLLHLQYFWIVFLISFLLSGLFTKFIYVGSLGRWKCLGHFHNPLNLCSRFIPGVDAVENQRSWHPLHPISDKVPQSLTLASPFVPLFSQQFLAPSALFIPLSNPCQTALPYSQSGPLTCWVGSGGAGGGWGASAPQVGEN